MKRLAPLLLILLLATTLRFHRLAAQSFWNDEGNSARLSERSLSLIIEGTASDIHPPLYYLILRGWRELVGDSEFGLRSVSAFAGILTAALTIAAARLTYPRQRRLPWLAGLLAALSPPLIYYSQEARMYELLALSGIGSAWLLLRLARRWPQQWRDVSRALPYVLALAAGLYTHYFFPIILAAHAVWLWAWHGWRRLFVWGGLVAAAVILYLPWIPIFLRQLGTRPRSDISVAEFAPVAWRWLAFGPTVTGSDVTLPLLAVSALLLLALLPSAGWSRCKTRLLPLAGVLLPVAFMLAAGTTRPAFYKFLTLAVPFFVLWLASGLNAAWTFAAGWRGINAGSRALTLLLACVLCWGVGVSLRNLYGNPAYARADYRGMAARIAAASGENDGILLNAPNQWEVFTYYYKGPSPVYPIPRGAPDAAIIDAELSQIAARHTRLYALFWGEAERDPQRLVERWLDSHAFKAADEWVGDVRFVIYALPSAPAAQMETPTNLLFGSQIRLQGYTLTSDTLSPGEIIQVMLFWQALAPIDTRYKVFLHLLGPSGLIAQRDSEPGGGLALTTTWVPGETVVDNLGLLVPSHTPVGDYTLLLGLYDLTDPTNRLLVNLNDQPTDAFVLPPIHVR